VIAAAFWLMARAAPLPLWCWTLAFMIWLMPMLEPAIAVSGGQDRPAPSRPADRVAAIALCRSEQRDQTPRVAARVRSPIF
jgi:hypothetical protein